MKKTISLILCVAMILSTVAFAMPAFAIDLDFGVEASEDFAQKTETPEASLLGTVSGDDGKPGINIITGTTAAYDFEDPAYAHAILVPRSEGIVADPDDADNRVMWLGYKQFSNIGITPVLATEINHEHGYEFPLLVGKTFEPGRPFHVSFMLKGDMPADKGVSLMSGIGNAGPGWKTLNTFTISDGMNWVKQETTITYAQATSSLGTFVLCFLAHGDNNTAGNFYIDDISIVPDYGVLYYDRVGDKMVACEYLDYKTATSYTIPEAKYKEYENDDKFLGFKFVGDDDTQLIEGEITLAGEDLHIMPVFDTNLKAVTHVDAAEGTTFEVTSKVPVTEWSVDDEMLVSIEGDENSATLTTKGYSGLVTVTAVGDGWEESVGIYLKGGTKFAPGVNFGTGTKEPVTFEKDWEVYTAGRDTSVVDGSSAAVSNGTKKVLSLKSSGPSAAGQNYPQIFFPTFDYKTIEADRPLVIAFDYTGSFQNLWPLDFSGKTPSLGGGSSSAWAHFEKTLNKKATSVNNGFQWGKLQKEAVYVDNMSLTPYYKVTYLDATGVVTSYEYVAPSEEKYVIPAEKIAALDAAKYEGFVVEGTEEVVSEVALKNYDIVFMPAVKDGVELTAPVSVTGHGGLIENIDPKYPGVYYTFDEPLDLDTVTLDELKNVWADSFTYDEETNTLIVFSEEKKVVGHSEYFQAYDSNVKTESGKFVVFPKTPELTYATAVVNDGMNMIPYGDFETAYNPFYAIDTTVDVSVEEGKLYARANTEEPSFPHTAFQTVLEAGATYKVYAETKAIDVEDAEPGLNIIFAGDTEGGIVNHGSVDNYHVTDNTVATIEKVDGTLYFDAEFKVSALDGDAKTAIAQAAMYSSPVADKTVGYTIDNYELYRRTDVKYVPNDVVVSEGVEVPVDGAYLTLKGGVANEEAFVTVADYIFPAIDEKRYVDGWISLTDGITYKAGDTINLAEVELDENGEYPLGPVVVAAEGYKAINITFEKTDLVTKTPAGIEGAYMTKDVLDMAQFYSDDIVSAVSGKRFLGWSVDGTKAGIVQPGDDLVLEDHVHFTPVVGYDYNFAIKDSQSGWGYNLGSVKYEDYVLKAIHTKVTEKSNDAMITRTGVNVPAGDIHKIIFWVEEDYVLYSDKDHTEAVPSKWQLKDTWEGLFFSHTGQNDAGERRLGCTASETVTGPDGKVYIGFVADTTNNSNWKRNDVLYKIRLDPNNIFGDLNIRYIQFIEFDDYEYTNINIVGLDTPATGCDVDLDAEDKDGLFDVTSVEWTPDNFIKYTYENEAHVAYTADTEYTARIKVRVPASAMKKFAENITATVNGEEVPVVKTADGVAILEYTFGKTESFKPFTATIEGPEAIAKEGRTTQYKFVVNGDIPLRTATWSLGEGDENYAKIDPSTGKLTPIRDTETDKPVTVIAVSNYNPEVREEIKVTLTNQAEVSYVIYDKNTADDVKVPEKTEGIGRIKLTDEAPVRSGYVFAGWAESPESRTRIDSITPSGKEVTVYAIWDKALASFEFNNSNDGFNSVQAGVATLHDTYLELNSNGNGDLRIQHKGGLTIDPNKVDRVVVRQSATTASTAIIAYFWVPGQGGIDGGNASAATTGTFEGLHDWKEIEIDFTVDPDWSASANIPKFAYDPLNGVGQTAYIDYIRFLDDDRTITFVANAGEDAVTGMPVNCTALVGTKYSVAETPVREGYEFLGWAKTADAAEIATEFYVGEDLTLYAMWAKAVAVSEADPTLVEVVAPAEEAIVVAAPPATVVTVTVTTAEGGEPVVIPATVDDTGLLHVSLKDINGITKIEIAADKDIEKVLLTDDSVAEALLKEANKDDDDEDADTTIKINGVDKDGEEGGGRKQYDTTVETVKNENASYKPTGSLPTINNATEGGEGGEAVDVKSLMSESGEILLNFNSKSEADFFPTASLRQFALNGVSDSVISFTNKGKASGSNDSPALFTTSFELDAATHPYIVMKLRNTTDGSCRIYFRTAEAGFAEARALSKNFASDYTMVVYDMSTIADWKGSVTGMFFSFGATAGEIVEIDWIMFTDKLPESMDAIEGTRELFPIVNKGAMTFEDVKNSEWYYSEVASAYRLGFVQGQSEKAYNPQGNVTVAEAITLAVRLNYNYNGKDIPEVAEGAEWYKNYVNAAVRAGIIKNTQFADYNVPALRKDVAQIMNKALPSDYLGSINMFTSVPDVPTKDPAYGAVRKLYNAGILMGMDEAYNFYPNNNITRAEMAAVVNRMAIPANRKRVVTEAELESRRKYYYAEDLETASLGNCYETKLKIKGDFAYGTGKTGDPIVYLTNVVGQLNGKEITKITVALKWDESKIKASPVMFFTTPAGGWAAGRMLSSKNTGEKTENGSTIFTLDPKSNGQFADTITGLRFDPFDAKDIEFAIEYIIIE